jgi:hypothetical protein
VVAWDARIGEIGNLKKKAAAWHKSANKRKRNITMTLYEDEDRQGRGPSRVEAKGAEMAGLNLKSKIYVAPGYSSDLQLEPHELAMFRSAISEQWLSVIESHHPDLVEQFQRVGIQNYHEISHLIDHEKMWPKENRCLPLHSCKKIKALPFLRTLKNEFGDFELADVFYGDTHVAGREEIYWRLVRPAAATDVGSLHADKWFHEVMSMGDRAFPRGRSTVKVWIPIYSVPGKNGLMIVPNSHQRDYRYHAVPGMGGMKPHIDEDVANLGAELMLTDPGRMLIFNEGTLHGGAVNRGGETRVSAEITMVFQVNNDTQSHR